MRLNIALIDVVEMLKSESPISDKLQGKTLTKSVMG